jgi:hypothetical protein
MRNLVSRPHIILSVENPGYPASSPVSHDVAVKSLEKLGGGKVHTIKGHYGKPEQSILISDPSDEQAQFARHLAHSTGQESHIESDGHSHKMYFNNGPKAGSIVHGRGTKWHSKAPKDYFTTLPSGETFTHNFEMEKAEKTPGSGVKINPQHGAQIAQAYESMKHDPSHPDVKAAYGALISETKDQFKKILGSGFKISKIKPGQANPYKTSKDMHHDIEHNKHLWYFPTEAGFGSSDQSSSDHPMLAPTEFTHGDHKLLANDMFRIVHDINGHHLGGKSGFGPKGEHEAYLHHKTMYSPMAGKALATETMGQNNTVNFGRHGENNRKNPSKTIYADQKAGLLPDNIINGDWHK